MLPIPSPSKQKTTRSLRSLGRNTILAATALLGSLAFTPKADAVITFVFTYNDAPGVGFNDPAHPEYKQGLEAAAQMTGSFYANTATVTLAVNSTNNKASSTLASAGSTVVSPTGAPGFYRNVIQEKILSNGANDLNGDEPDGVVDVNLGSAFQFDPTAPVGEGQIDFVGTMIHELTHALGFSSDLDQTPNTQPLTLSIFDSFLTTSDGKPLINTEKQHFRQDLLPTLTGGNSTLMDTPGAGGVFFSGPNAMAANGGQRVPIYSPNPYQTGSSISHLDDNTAAFKPLLMAAVTEAANAEQIMMGVTMPRSYSAVEKAIMTDLGYTLN